MKKGISCTLLILFSLLMLLPFLGRSQATYTAPIGYNTGAPTAAPSASGTRWRFDLLTGRTYKWSPTAIDWILDGYGIDNVTGCVPPAYTPAYGQSIFAVNGCDSLYGYRAGHWRHLNPGGSGGGTNIYAGSGITFSGISPDITINADDVSAENELNTALYVDGGSLVLDDGGGTVSVPLNQFRAWIYNAGTGISINSGTGAISNTGDLSNTNELQTLSIAGQDLSLSLGGGTVTIPGGSSLGVGFTNGGGSGTIPTATATFDATSILFGVDAADQFKVANTNTSDPGSEANLEIVSGTVNFYVKAGSEDRSVTMNVVPGAVNFEARNSDMNFNASRSLATINLISTPATLVFSNPDANVIFTDNREEAARFGIEYADEYPEILDHDRSFLDVGLAKQLIASENGALGTGFTAGGGSGTIPAETTVLSDGNRLLLGNSTVGGDLIKFNGFFDGNQSYFGTGYDFALDGDYTVVGNLSAISGSRRVRYSMSPFTQRTAYDNDDESRYVDFSINDIGVGLSISGTSKGFFYNDNYEDVLIADDRNVPDVGTAKKIVKNTAGSICLKDFYSDVNNSGTTPSTLYSYSTDPNLFSADGDKIIYKFAGTFNDASVTSYALSFEVSGTQVVNTNTASGVGAFEMEITVIRTGSSTARAISKVIYPGSTQKVFTKYTDLTGMDYTNNVFAQILAAPSGGTAGSNDITAKIGTIYFSKAAL